MNPNCYHLHGPTGVQLATQRIREALATEKPKYIIRADIKSYYKSIQHHVLIEDIKRHYLERCKRRMMTILKERHLQLSRKKTRIGSISGGFHFLGINYLETQAPDSTNVTQDSHGMAANESFAEHECLLVSQAGRGVSTV